MKNKIELLNFLIDKEVYISVSNGAISITLLPEIVPHTFPRSTYTNMVANYIIKEISQEMIRANLCSDMKSSFDKSLDNYFCIDKIVRVTL